MTTQKLIKSVVIAALPLLGMFGLGRVCAQDEKSERPGGTPGVAVPGNRDPRPRIGDREPGEPPDLDPGNPNPGGPNFNPGAARDPNALRDPTAPRGPRGEGRGGPPGFRGQFSPGSPNPFQGPFGMRPNDPEMEKLMRTDVELDRQSRNLAERFRAASKDEQDEIKKKLSEIVTAQFEARQERRTLELKHLEDEIKRIRESIDKRNHSKEQIVDRRVSELLGQDDNSF
jgi:hypothetical protein